MARKTKKKTITRLGKNARKIQAALDFEGQMDDAKRWMKGLGTKERYHLRLLNTYSAALKLLSHKEMRGLSNISPVSHIPVQIRCEGCNRDLVDEMCPECKGFSNRYAQLFEGVPYLSLKQSRMAGVCQ